MRDYNKEYYSRPEVKERLKEYYSREDVKKRLKEYYNKTDIKQKKKLQKRQRYKERIEWF